MIELFFTSKSLRLFHSHDFDNNLIDVDLTKKIHFETHLIVFSYSDTTKQDDHKLLLILRWCMIELVVV